ncbi:hypothetical protein [Streptomyces shaanxiensis]
MDGGSPQLTTLRYQGVVTNSAASAREVSALYPMPATWTWAPLSGSIVSSVAASSGSARASSRSAWSRADAVSRSRVSMPIRVAAAIW